MLSWRVRDDDDDEDDGRQQTKKLHELDPSPHFLYTKFENKEDKTEEQNKPNIQIKQIKHSIWLSDHLFSQKRNDKTDEGIK